MMSSLQLFPILSVVLSLSTVNAFVTTPVLTSSTSSSSSSFDTACHAELTVPGMWNGGNNYGKGDFRFYKSFYSFSNIFTKEDRDEFPEIFQFPKGMYEVSMAKPLGIVFEEIEIGNGVYVQDLVEGGFADTQGKIQPGDVLVGVTAIKVVGAKWERRMLPARKFDFDTAVGAIGSNERKWNCDDVVLMFERPSEADSDAVDAFLEFFEPPFDNPWKQQQ